jgi:hypothetical protein
MKKIKGVVKLMDVEGGVWVLDTGDGTYQLKGGPDELYQQGRMVAITGNIRKDLMSTAMVGPVFEVESIE